MTLGLAQLTAELSQLESDLATAWLRREDIRAQWEPDPEEFHSPHAALLMRAGRALPDSTTGPDGDLSSVIMCDKRWRGELLKAFGDGPMFSLDYVADLKGDLARAETLRSLVRLQDTVSRAVSGVNPSTDLAELLKTLRGAIVAEETRNAKKAYSEQDLFELVAKSVREKVPDGLSTGFGDLDKATGGIRPGYVWAFGAPTNWGKSSWLLALLDRWLLVHEVPALYVTCEDEPSILAARLMSRRTGISGNDLRDLTLTPEDHKSIVDAWAKTKPAEVMLDGRGMDVSQIAGAIRARVKRDGVKLVLVDYLQCMTTATKHQDRRNEINHISRTLTEAIKGSGAAGVLASQVTDENLRESRDLENAAEVVVIGRQEDNGPRDLYLKKNKTGSKGWVIDAPWDEKTAAFQNVTEVDAIAADFDWDN